MSSPGARGSREPVWFRRPAPDVPGTLNVTYQLLDRRVVAGQADDVVLGGQTVARVLTDVAAFAGALRGFAVVPGDRVLLHLADGMDLAVAALAAARLGAVVVLTDPALPVGEVVRALEATEPRVVVTGDEAALGLALADAEHAPDAVIGARSVEIDERSDGRALPWDMAVRAGQTDPAGAADVVASHPAVVVWPDGSATTRRSEVRMRSALDLATALAALDVPLTPSELLVAVRG